MPAWRVELIGLAALFILALVARDLLQGKNRGTPQWTTAISFSVAVLLLVAWAKLQYGPHPRTLVMDSTSLQATFTGISTQGPQQQLVFHYRLQNRGQAPRRIQGIACSTVSFRFKQEAARYDPASALLEKDPASYAKYTGLHRLETSPGMVLEPCPIDLAAKASKDVAIAVPYAYSSNSETPPSSDELKTYVRAAMPRIDGFGAADPQSRYLINFPAGW